MTKAAYKRILLKLSGEAFLGKRESGIDLEAAEKIAEEVLEISKFLEVAVVVGGGNFFRGAVMENKGLDRATGDYIGMLATIMNALALQDILELKGADVRVMTAIESPKVAEPYIRRKALSHFEKGRIIILAAGTGHPYFSTDTAAALRALELRCEVMLKATKVEGVYHKDPNLHQDAKKFERLSFQKAIRDRLKILDSTALALCREHNLPVVVFNLFEEGNIMKVVKGEKIGTLIS